MRVFESRLPDTTLKLADIATAQGDFTMAGYLKEMAAKVCDDPRFQRCREDGMAPQLCGDFGLELQGDNGETYL